MSKISPNKLQIAEGFSENLRLHMKRTGCTRTELARRSGIHRTQIGAMLKGEVLPMVTTVMQLAGSLGVTADELVDGITWEAATPDNPLGGVRLERKDPALLLPLDAKKPAKKKRA